MPAGRSFCSDEWDQGQEARGPDNQHQTFWFLGDWAGKQGSLHCLGEAVRSETVLSCLGVMQMDNTKCPL